MSMTENQISKEGNKYKSPCFTKTGGICWTKRKKKHMNDDHDWADREKRIQRIVLDKVDKDIAKYYRKGEREATSQIS